MIPSSWYRMAEIKGRDEQPAPRAAARHRDIGAAASPAPAAPPRADAPWSAVSAAGRMHAVTARILDGKAVAAQIRSRGSRARAGPRRNGHHPGPGRRPRGRRPGLSHLRRAEAQGVRRRRDPLRAGRPAVLRHRARAARDDPPAEPRPRDPRHPAAAAPARAPRRAGDAARDRAREGRRRAASLEHRDDGPSGARATCRRRRTGSSSCCCGARSRSRARR